MKNEEIIELFNSGKNCSEIAKIFNCNAETIRLRLKKEGINTSKKKCNVKCIHCGDNSVTKHGKQKNGEQNYFCFKCDKYFLNNLESKLLKKEELYNNVRRLYLEDGLSTTEIGKLLNLSSGTPQNIIKELGISRTISEAKKGKKRGSKLPISSIIELYLSGKSSSEISKMLNVSKRSVLNILIENNIPRDNEYNILHPQIEIIKELYLSGKSMMVISKEIEIPYSTINRNLHKLGIVRTEDRFRIGMDYDLYLETLPAFKKYKQLVYKLTEKEDLNKLSNYEKRGKAGVDGAYHLDHKFSINEGFKQGIEPEIIANINNLWFIPWEENIKKLDKCSISLEELLKLVKN